jgi:hypothetical protein
VDGEQPTELISISWWKTTTLRKESESSNLDMSRKVVDRERRLTELARWFHVPAPAGRRRGEADHAV